MYRWHLKYLCIQCGDGDVKPRRGTKQPSLSGYILKVLQIPGGMEEEGGYQGDRDEDVTAHSAWVLFRVEYILALYFMPLHCT